MTDTEDLGALYDDILDEKTTTAAADGSARKAAEVTNRRAYSSTTDYVAPAKSSASSLSISSPATTAAQLQRLQEKVSALEAENRLLKRNMGMLYRTARREMIRKDRQISDLMIGMDKKN